MSTEVEYNHLFGTLPQQTTIVKLFSQLEKERKELTERAAPSSPVAAFLGPRPSLGRDISFFVQFVHF